MSESLILQVINALHAELDQAKRDIEMMSFAIANIDAQRAALVYDQEDKCRRLDQTKELERLWQELLS